MNDLTRYLAIRASLRPGDVIAFAGTSPISKLIGLFSGRSWNPSTPALSHIALVHTAMEAGTLRVLITQSTIEKGKSGAQAAYLSDVLADYQGQVWDGPLSEEIRAEADWARFDAFIHASEGRIAYDTAGLFGFIARALPIIGTRICQAQDANRMVCSGYGTAAFKEARFLRGINTSQVSPQQLMEMAIYAPGPPVQLIGKPAMFAGYNSI